MSMLVWKFSRSSIHFSSSGFLVFTNAEHPRTKQILFSTSLLHIVHILSLRGTFGLLYLANSNNVNDIDTLNCNTHL